MNTEFASRLKQAMEAAGLTASELSKESNVGKSDSSNYLNGKYLPKQDKCYLLAKALNVDPGWLMTGIEQSPLHALVNNAVHAGMVMERNISGPKTEEAKIISAGIDKMSPDRREQALKVLQTIFADIFDGGEK